MELAAPVALRRVEPGMRAALVCSVCQWSGPIGRNTCVLAWSPAMPKLRGACHTPVID